jgi:hypothetical protein
MRRRRRKYNSSRWTFGILMTLKMRSGREVVGRISEQESVVPPPELRQLRSILEITERPVWRRTAPPRRRAKAQFATTGQRARL